MKTKIVVLFVVASSFLGLSRCDELDSFDGDMSRTSMGHLKRSLCNTFGGCGSKRSLSLQDSEDLLEADESAEQQQDQPGQLFNLVPVKLSSSPVGQEQGQLNSNSTPKAPEVEQPRQFQPKLMPTINLKNKKVRMLMALIIAEFLQNASLMQLPVNDKYVIIAPTELVAKLMSQSKHELSAPINAPNDFPTLF